MKHEPTDDAGWMAQAIALAARGEGRTRPNPPVGAVVVRKGRPVGTGWHRRAGTPHAEVHALRAAGAAARGATLYVTLEPCCTHGRTPPCTDAILAAGIARVVAGSTDPNPRHRGRGLRLLSAAGVGVEAGVLRPACDALIEPFRSLQTRGRPWVTLKLGMTLDGRLGDAAGNSRWITSVASRRRVHAWRRRADAVLVGAETVRRDDPSLLCRGGRHLRIVLAGRRGLPAGARVLCDEAADRTVVVTTADCPPACRRAYQRHGSRVCLLPGQAGRVKMGDLMRALGDMGLLHVLCEGGGKLAGLLAREELVDRYLLFVAPRLLGADGVPALAGGWPLAQAPELVYESVEACGSDVLITARPGRPAAGRGDRSQREGAR